MKECIFDAFLCMCAHEWFRQSTEEESGASVLPEETALSRRSLEPLDDPGCDDSERARCLAEQDA